MSFTRYLIIILFFAITTAKSEFSKDGVVLVAPVLAPFRNSRAKTAETAKDFPLLMLLAGDSTHDVDQAKRNEPLINKPVYVHVAAIGSDATIFENHHFRRTVELIPVENMHASTFIYFPKDLCSSMSKSPQYSKRMDSKILLIFLGTLLSVNCLVEKLLLSPKVQAPFYRGKQQVRGRRDSSFAATAPLDVLVMTGGGGSKNGAPNSMYRGSYNGEGGSYGVSGAAFGTKKTPSEISNVPDYNYVRPVMGPYVVVSTI
ncbi:unnamed protein product [Chrysodeixis includens]|uniref:Uncharacterized protein n=1 Tax=Chrysodeixis includens TaxID=689277 RepID=A0A9N8KTK4_CHRIL|nr:unnamed protein product [Chrysodeixis includens]